MRPAILPATTDGLRPGEFVLRDEDFHAFCRIVKEMTGIKLNDSKRELVYGRIARRLRALGLGGFGEYRQLLESGDSNEAVEFCNAMTTNLTSFFREARHLDYLRDEVFPAYRSLPANRRRIRIWSAGCSTGEEPYSIAMVVLECFPDLPEWDIKILASDVDSHVLATAERGIYASDRIKGIDAPRMQRFFRDVGHAGTAAVEVDPALKRLVTFRRVNLMQELPMSGPLDVIFCRNVVIYFDKETQRDMFGRFSRLQRGGDLLFIGHSENLLNVSEDYSLLGKSMYRRNSQ